RLGVTLGLAAGLVTGAVLWFQFNPDFPKDPDWFGALVLMGIPLFYLLTFAGMAEETEIEIAAICGALGLGLWMFRQTLLPYPQAEWTLFAIPLIIYFYYTIRVLPALRVFKHVLRGLSYARIGQYRWALKLLARAVALDPQNAMAREGLWTVHREMDLAQVAG